MGNQDGPKAPAGWYSTSDSEPGERYWDGNSWTEEYRGLRKPEPETEPVPEEKPKKEKATSAKGWLWSLSILVVFFIVLAFAIPAGTKDAINTDKAACELLSTEIAKVNEKNYGSVSAISSQNQLDELAKSAKLASLNPDPFGFDQGNARDSLLMGQLEDFATTFTFSSDLSEASSGNIAPGHEPGTSLYRSYQKLQLAVSRCGELGFQLENSTFNFDVPLQELAPKEVAQKPQQQVNSQVIPEDFTDAGNGMSYKFIDGTCSYLHCAYVQIYADTSCSSVYVEANSINADGVILGMTNDMIGVMNPGDSAVATLNILEDAATGVRLTKVLCY